MSVRKLSEVWELSAQSGSGLLMLIALADFSDDAGRSYPSVPTLARKCRMSTRNANMVLAGLRTSGELAVIPNAGPHGTNAYQITLKPPSWVKQASGGRGEECFRGRGEADFLTPLKPASDKPSLNLNTELAHSAPTPSPDSTSRRGTRLPADWELPEDWRDWCLENRPDLDPDTTAECFRDHWHAKSGRDATKVDWLATWRNWCRNQRSRPGSSGAGRGAGAGRTPLSTDHVFTLEG